MTQAISVRWLTRYGPEGASSRYRVHQYVDGLRDRGVESSCAPLAAWRSPLWRQALGLSHRVVDLAMKGRGNPNVVVVQKEPVMPPSLWSACRRLVRPGGIPLVWDVDDAVWLGRRGALSMATSMAHAADLVVAGNDLIADWMVRAGARSVQVLPTCFRPQIPPQRADRERSTVEVVWVGSPATARLLAAHRPALQAILADPSVRLTLVGGSIPALGPAEQIRVVAWSPEAEHEWLSTADYGLALQPRNEYADHKCGFKIIQYMAYGVVPIASDGPVHRQIVGDTGLLLAADPLLAELTDRVGRAPTADERALAVQRWSARYDRTVGEAAWCSILGALA